MTVLHCTPPHHNASANETRRSTSHRHHYAPHCTTDQYASLVQYYVSDAAEPHRFKVSTEPESGGWVDQFSFYAYSSSFTGMTRYYASVAANPHRFKISTEPGCCGWTDELSFYAFDGSFLRPAPPAPHLVSANHLCHPKRHHARAATPPFYLAI